MSQASSVSLANIGNGAALERFDHELKKVLANIKDPNTDPKKARKITLEIVLQPHGDRLGMQAHISCNSKLASVPAVPAGTIFMLKNEEGEIQAYSHDIRQDSLFKEETPAAEQHDNVLPMQVAKAV